MKKLFLIVGFVGMAGGAGFAADPSCMVDVTTPCHIGYTNKQTTYQGFDCTMTSATVNWKLCMTKNKPGSMGCLSTNENCIWTDTVTCSKWGLSQTFTIKMTNSTTRTYADGRACPEKP